MYQNTQKLLIGVFAALIVVTVYIVLNIAQIRPDDDPVYSEWGSWSQCSKPCDEGVKKRSRVCLPGSSKDEDACSRLGTAEEAHPCNERPCPVDGAFGQWSEYNLCNKPCGVGTQKRTRKCDSPEPEFGGKYCFGPEEETRECNVFECDVDGGYTEWEKWSECSDPCSTRKRIRKCENPRRLGKGKDCSVHGNPEEVDKCDKAKCDQLEAEKKKKEEEEKKKKDEEEKKKKDEEEKKKKDEEEKKKKDEEEKKKKEEEEKKKKDKEKKKEGEEGEKKNK